MIDHLVDGNIFKKNKEFWHSELDITMFDGKIQHAKENRCEK